MAHDLLSPAGQLLLVGRNLIQNKVEGRDAFNVYGCASLEENRKTIVSQLPTLLEESIIKVSVV